jgi:hypothetical protein
VMQVRFSDAGSIGDFVALVPIFALVPASAKSPVFMRVRGTYRIPPSAFQSLLSMGFMGFAQVFCGFFRVYAISSLFWVKIGAKSEKRVLHCAQDDISNGIGPDFKEWRRKPSS